MITPFHDYSTYDLEDHRIAVEEEYIEKSSDPRYDTSIIIGLREELICIDNELQKRYDASISNMIRKGLSK